jgi:hypothetical protein
MKEFRLGVLLVHGIGTQPPRDTLVRWGDVLLELIGRATQPPVTATAGRASAGDRSGDRPAEVAIDIRDGAHQEKWLLAEGWWAESFPAPTYSELVSWSVRAIPWSIALHIAQRYWQAEPDASWRAKLLARTKAVIQLLVAMALAPVFITLLAAALLLGLLPIPQLRSLILSAQTTLIGTVGDSLAFVESPLRAALVRNRILDGLERLQERCERTVIVAHSQGAAAVLDALGGITPGTDHERKPTSHETTPEGPIPDVLVTFGSGVNQLVSLKVLSQGLPKQISTNPVPVAVAAMLVMTGLFVFFYIGSRSGSITFWLLGEAAVFLSVVLGGIFLLMWGIVRLIDRLAARRVLAVEKATANKIKTLIIATVALFVFLFNYREDLPVFPVILLFMALFFLAASLVLILSPTMKDAVTGPVRTPPRLTRWIDLYASADPVPNGRTRIAQATSAEATSVPIWNRGSILSDHTTYWDNLDGFVLRIARVCAETAESPWQEKLPPPVGSAWADRRAAWRVGFLRWAVRINALFWLFAFLLLWTRYQAHIPLPFELPSWLPAWMPALAQFAALVIMVAAAAWATAALLRWPWSLWVRAEQEAVLAHKYPTDHGGLTGMGMVISLLVLSASALARGYEFRAGDLLADLGGWFTPLMLIVLGSFLYAWIAVRLSPPPKAPDDKST